MACEAVVSDLYWGLGPCFPVLRGGFQPGAGWSFRSCVRSLLRCRNGRCLWVRVALVLPDYVKCVAPIKVFFRMLFILQVRFWKKVSKQR